MRRRKERNGRAAVPVVVVLVAVAIVVALVWRSGRAGVGGERSVVGAGGAVDQGAAIPPRGAVASVPEERREANDAAAVNGTEPADPESSGSVGNTRVVGRDYDVVQQIVDSLGRLDPDRSLASLQLNPDGRALSAEFRDTTRRQLVAFAQQDRQLMAETQKVLSEELHELAASGRIPELRRERFPGLFERVESRARAVWLRRHEGVAEDELDGDRAFQMFLKNKLCDELRRDTPHQIRIDVGRTGATHVAGYADCPAYVAAMLRGDRERLEAEAMRYVISGFGLEGALSGEQGEALWQRFRRLQERAMKRKLAAIK